MKYLAGHIRLPNVKINVIDYPNATGEQIPMLDKYRQEAKLRPTWDKQSYLKILDKNYSTLAALSKSGG
jgi:hypothetical protein